MNDYNYLTELSSKFSLRNVLSKNPFFTKILCERKDSLDNFSDLVILQTPVSNNYLEILKSISSIKGVHSYDSHYSFVNSNDDPFNVVSRNYVPGQTLTHYLNDFSLSKNEEVFFQDSIGMLVSKIHEKGYSGLDIRRSNILLNEHLEPVLFDFDYLFSKQNSNRFFNKLKDADLKDVDELFSRQRSRSDSDLIYSEFYNSLRK